MINLKQLAIELHGQTNCNPLGMSLWALWREDLKTHDNLLIENGFSAWAVHRFGIKRMDIWPKFMGLPFCVLYNFLFRCVDWSCGISLPYTVPVGRTVRLWHNRGMIGGMILHARSIWDDCHIRHYTTFGVSHTHANESIPTIGNRVDWCESMCFRIRCDWRWSFNWCEHISFNRSASNRCGCRSTGACSAGRGVK